MNGFCSNFLILVCYLVCNSISNIKYLFLMWFSSFHLSLYLPVKQSVQILKDKVLVIFDHRISLSNTQVDSGFVDQLLILAFVRISSSKLKMLLEAINGFSNDTFLVIEETKFEESICLEVLVLFIICECK